MNGKSFSSTPKALLNIAIYFILFEAGDLINALFWDYIFGNLLPGIFNSEFQFMIRMLGQLLLTCLFFWFYTAKVVNTKEKTFRYSVTVNFVPLPTSLSTSIFPSCAWIICLAMARPIPTLS